MISELLEYSEPRGKWHFIQDDLEPGWMTNAAIVFRAEVRILLMKYARFYEQFGCSTVEEGAD